ncbi:MAG: hypothetical protein WBP93_11640, partial [Pyrinomonadaceae bacterium]
SKSVNGNGEQFAPPPLERDAQGQLELTSVSNIIQWFLDYDQRVAVIKHPRVEEVFQWKQAESKRAGEDVFDFNSAEDRLAIGILQALAVHNSEADLHDWIAQLLNALDEATKMNEEMSQSYKLKMEEAASIVQEAAKIPTGQGRALLLTSCWLEALCTAEVRVLGWLYQELYGKPFAPER